MRHSCLIVYHLCSCDAVETLQEMSSISRDFANWAHVRTKRIDTDDFKNLSDAGKAIQVEEENQSTPIARAVFYAAFRTLDLTSDDGFIDRPIEKCLLHVFDVIPISLSSARSLNDALSIAAVVSVPANKVLRLMKQKREIQFAHNEISTLHQLQQHDSIMISTMKARLESNSSRHA